MRFYWLLPSCLSVFVFSLPAQAGKLMAWRYSANQFRLVFTTDAGVQPKALLMFNPTRLIVDLPGTTLGRPTVREPIGGAIRLLRLGQADETTTRLVIELNPGYTLDPKQILIRGATPVEWSVQLPQPMQLPTPRTPDGEPTKAPLPPIHPSKN